MNSDLENKVLGLIQEESYRNYFFQNVKSIKWFYPLKEHNFFSPENIPNPLKVEDGYQIPFWMPLLYLERVSLQIKEGKYTQYIKEILSIINEVSQAKKENYHVWYYIIKILSDISNDKIPIEIFNYIPVWLTSRFDITLPSAELCKKLIPKFLPENPTEEDIKKAEKIFEYIFTIKEISPVSDSETLEVDGISSGYVPVIDLYWLKEALIEKRSIEQLGRFCSNNIVFIVADTLKKLLVDYPSGLNTHFTIQDQDYHIRVIIADKDLIISWKLISEEIKNHAKTQFKIENYEMYDSGMLTNQIKNSLNNSGIDISKSATAQEEIDRIVYTLFNDTSIIWCSSIQKLGDKYLHGDRPKDTFALILRDLINAKAKFNKKDLTEIIHKFLSREYKLPFFRRLVLYIISQKWADYNKVFWDMVKNNDEAGYFSSEHFRKEIYYLLNNNIQLFNGEERKQLQQIIEKGPQEDRRDRGENYTDYWKLEWYSAMKDDQDYSEKYRTLSKKLEVTYDHYEKLGEIEIRWGSQSPFSLEDLIKMDNSHIVRNIFNFQPKNIWEDPSVDGFADMLGKAVQERPEKFANELERYHGIYFIYAYYILKGFTDAWRNKKPFNWENVLNYCLNYIISPGFKTDELKLENDSWRVDRKWIVGAVGNLISEGTQKDSNAFNTSLLPLTKKILLVLIPELDAADDLKVTKIDYPTYSLNSTAGKLLRALLDYSLRYARLYGSTEEKKWDDTLKALFEETLQKGIIDGYILQGMYIQQFIYLDKNWIINQIKKYYKLEEKFWVGFMGGYLFNHIIDNKELYKLMIPHFKRIIQFKGDFKDLSISDVAKHIAGHYLLGYESINKDSLIRKFTTEGKARQIISLVQFIWTQKEYYNSLEEQKKNFLRDRVFDLWKYILNRFKEDKSENTLKLISDLSKFAVYIEEINSENIEFLKTSAEVINTNYNSSFFIEELMRLKDKGNPEITAHYIGELFKLMLLNSTPDYDQETIKLIVTFLYKNKATKKEIKGMADDICNEYGKRGYLFLREIYNQYN